MFVIDGRLFSWLIIILSTILSFFSWVPNILDQYMGAQYENEGVLLTRNRHPLTHSPWTIFYFLPFLYLVQKSHIPILESIISLLAISWISHLVLDSLNPGGLPLGIQPVFRNHPVKHYRFHSTRPQETRRLRLARIPFNDPKANKNLGQFGLFIFSLNCTRTFLSFFRS